MGFVITKQWLKRWGNGSGWTAEQCRALNVVQTSGWVKRLRDQEISDDQLARFIAGRRPPRQRALAVLNNYFRMARRRVGLPRGSKADVAARIRATYTDAPAVSHDELFAWYAGRVRGTPAPARASKPDLSSAVFVASDEFLATYAWRRLRMEVLKERGRRCECCGATPADGVTVIHVDHIKPRRLHPELALIESNLQILCGVCNHGKGNWDQTDWRAPAPLPTSPGVVESAPSARAQVPVPTPLLPRHAPFWWRRSADIITRH